MIVIGCNQMEDFDCWDDDLFGADKAYSDGKFAMIITAIVLMAFFLIVFVSGYNTANVNQTKNIEHNELATVYDSKSCESTSNVLVEHEEQCPECGNVSVAVNNDIVCRNKNCPNYGLAVPIGFSTEN